SLIGTETTIIPERLCAPGIYEGYSTNYMKVRVASKERDILGELVKVRLTSISANNPELIGGKIIS
ncbi:MAG: hypothetical protein IKC08_03645, partial [Lentisphaeria bacterium]|nr:hypothetical protein [Lentisphaeria bacterium]